MKILLHMGFSFPRGNACANRMRVFYEVFKELGHEVKVLAPENSGTFNEINPQDVLICKTYKMKQKTAIARLKNNLTFAISSIIRAKDIDNVDVVITTSPPPLISLSGWFIALKKKAKLVYDVRDIWPDVALEMGRFSKKSIYCKIFRFIANFMYNHADLILTVSPGKIKKIKKYVRDADRVILCENGIDEKFLRNTIDDSVVERYKMKNHFNVVYIGNIGLAQGLEKLLELAKKVKDKRIQFLLFGVGAEKEILEGKKEKEKINNLFFEGEVLEHEVFNILRNAQISYIPLVNANLRDSIPTKTYEALSVGCPVLMVAEGDAVSLISESNFGWHISPSQTDQLESVFNKVLVEYNDILANKTSGKLQVEFEHS